MTTIRRGRQWWRPQPPFRGTRAPACGNPRCPRRRVAV